MNAEILEDINEIEDPKTTTNMHNSNIATDMDCSNDISEEQLVKTSLNKDDMMEFLKEE